MTKKYLLLGAFVVAAIAVGSGVWWWFHGRNALVAEVNKSDEVLAQIVAQTFAKYKDAHGWFPVEETGSNLHVKTRNGVNLEWFKNKTNSVGIVIDRWGTPYQITLGVKRIRVESAGPNKKFGDNDDIEEFAIVGNQDRQ